MNRFRTLKIFFNALKKDLQITLGNSVLISSLQGFLRNYDLWRIHFDIWQN